MSYGSTNVTLTQFAAKKLAGKALSSAILSIPGEPIGSNIQLASSVIFGQAVPIDPSGSFGSTPALYSIATNSLSQPVAEYVRLVATEIGGTYYDTDALTNSQKEPGKDSGGDYLNAGTGTSSPGTHGYQLSLPTDYHLYSSNTKINQVAGNGHWTGSQLLHETLGGIQIIQTNFSSLIPNPFNPTLYKTGGSTNETTTDVADKIFSTDFTDWSVDAFSGVVFVQDFDATKVPGYVDAWIYIGDMTSTAIAQGSAHSIHTSSVSPAYTQRGKLVFTGSGVESVTDDAGNDATVVKITAQSNNVFGNVQFISGSNTFNNEADTSNDILTLEFGPGFILSQPVNDYMIISASGGSGTATAFGTRSGSLQYIDNGELSSSINLAYIDLISQLQLSGSMIVSGALVDFSQVTVFSASINGGIF